ncbi:transmembrane family 220 protein [Larkinella arboricola]|uniref:Transmembrane family 220 protein n=1 Tax=Larkinella arboricola TaxID=643671 RepID=A0A327WRQ9_LARAB|nr:transmembrane 220 family protein [Larkinella arboricola]RAJ94343.1 transmembrane family 220 protein [Larkinella arboricola]
MRKGIAIFFGLLFILFAVFQYNDPDPQIWIPIYGVGAFASFMALGNAVRPWFFILAGLGYLVAAIYQWPPAFEGFLLDEMGMKTINIELARESGGLAICAIAMFILAVLTRDRIGAR